MAYESPVERLTPARKADTGRQMLATLTRWYEARETVQGVLMTASTLKWMSLPNCMIEGISFCLSCCSKCRSAVCFGKGRRDIPGPWFRVVVDMEAEVVKGVAESEVGENVEVLLEEVRGTLSCR